MKTITTWHDKLYQTTKHTFSKPCKCNFQKYEEEVYQNKQMQFCLCHIPVISESLKHFLNLHLIYQDVSINDKKYVHAYVYAKCK